MAICVWSQKIEKISPKVASNLTNIWLWYFCPDDNIEKDQGNDNQDKTNRVLNVNNKVQKSSIRSSQKYEKSTIDKES